MYTIVLPDTLYLALCATEGGFTPLETEERDGIVAFTQSDRLAAHMLKRRVAGQVIEVAAGRLSGMHVVLDPDGTAVGSGCNRSCERRRLAGGLEETSAAATVGG